MDSTRWRAELQGPHWLRACVHSLLILGIFAMHNVLAADGDLLTAHHGTSQSTNQSAIAMIPSALNADHHVTPVGLGEGQSPLGDLSDCCGVLMLCFSMILGVGALLFIRGKVAERVLWQLPPPSRLTDALRALPFQNLTPFQRSSILRC